MKLDTVQKKGLEDLIREFDIPFVVLFGSAATGLDRAQSDVDLGFNVPFPDMKVYTKMLQKCQHLFPEKDVDLVFLPSTDPLLRYQVTCNGVLVAGDMVAYREYQVKSFKEYIDTKPLRDLEQKLLTKRLHSLSSV